MNNQQKVALITGAARRVGAAIARQLHADGMNVVVHYDRSEFEAQKLCQELNVLRAGSAVAIAADLLDERQYAGLIEQAAGQWGRLDALVNNAARFYATPVGSVNISQWQDLMMSNLAAPFFLAQAALPFLQKVNGCVVNIADIQAEKPLADHAVYSISKAGVVMMTKALAKDFGPLVRVNAVSPGAVIWPEGVNALTAEQQAKIISKTALQRHGDVRDVASAVGFLVGAAKYITGHVLTVDGGRLLDF
jgi:pteridine reductase